MDLRHNQLLTPLDKCFCNMDILPCTAFYAKQFDKLLDIGKRKSKRAKKAAFFHLLENLHSLKKNKNKCFQLHALSHHIFRV